MILVYISEDAHLQWPTINSRAINEHWKFYDEVENSKLVIECFMRNLKFRKFDYLELQLPIDLKTNSNVIWRIWNSNNILPFRVRTLTSRIPIKFAVWIGCLKGRVYITKLRSRGYAVQTCAHSGPNTCKPVGGLFYSGNAGLRPTFSSNAFSNPIKYNLKLWLSDGDSMPSCAIA